MISTSTSYLRNFFLATAVVLLFPFLANAGIQEHIIETESGFYYTVQKGDTLWDLSRNFSDSAWQWPDLWHYNPDIGNPHLIYPGQRIQIYRKSWEDMEKQETAAIKAAPQPAPSRYHVYSGINMLGFIRKTAVEPTGTVFKVKEDRQLISTNDKIYIRPATSGGMKEGSLYTLYRTSDPVRDPVNHDVIGIQHMIVGTVEITRIENGFVIGQVKDAYTAIETEDKLMPFQSRTERIIFSDPVAGLSGKIIKAEENQIMIGEHMIAFIDKGSRDGVKAGQSYRISYMETTGTRSFLKKPVDLCPEYIGSLLVLHTEETTSTVVITNSVNSITPGLPFEPFETTPITSGKQVALLPASGK